MAQKLTPMQQWAAANPHLAKQANIRKMRKEGQITKKVADQLLKANYDDRKASIKKAAKGSSGKRSTTTKSTKPAPVQPARNKGNTGSGRDGRPGTGTYGSQLPSNPQLKSQTKSKSKVQRAVDAATPMARQPRRSDSKPRNRRGSGIRRTGKKGINLRKLVDKVGKKLVHKKGDIKKVGGITYRHDGKRFVRYTM